MNYSAAGSEKDSWTVKWILRQNAGMMLFGADAGKKLNTTFPFHFEANGGTIVFSNTVAFVNFAVAHVTAGNTVTFECVPDADAEFAVDETVFATGDTIVSSEDADLLAHVAARINANLGAAVEYEAQVQGAAVRLALKTTERGCRATRSPSTRTARSTGCTAPSRSRPLRHPR